MNKSLWLLLVVLVLFAGQALAVEDLMAQHSFKKIGDSIVDTEALILGNPTWGKPKFGYTINGLAFQ
jgi:hypothetical protein